MKILVVTGRFGGNFPGGIERVSYEVTKRLAKAHEVRVLAQRRISDSESDGDGFHTRTTRSINVPRTNFWVYYYLFAKRRLVSQSITSFKPDIIYAHNPYDTYVSLGFRIPVVSHIHSLYTEYFLSQDSSRTILPSAYWSWFWKYRLSIEKKALSRSDLVITYSDFLADLARERGAKRVGIVPNGIDVSLFTPTGAQSTAVKSPAVVYVGRIEKAKGIDYLLQAAGRLPDVHFYLIGNEKDQYTYPENVFLLGSKNPAEIPAYLRSADIFLNPVIRDGFEIVNMEAMACDLPVITTDAFERTQLYRHSALLVKPADPSGIVAAIQELLDNKALRLKLVTEGKQLAARHDWSAISLAIDNLLRETAKRHNGALKSSR